MSERVRFEFCYEYGRDRTAHHFGALEREEFDRLASGDGPDLVRIDEVCTWDPDDRKYVAEGPGGGEPSGSAYFQRSRISRLWPASALAGISPEIAPPHRRASPKLRTAIEEFFAVPVEDPRIIKESLAESDIPNLELAVEDFQRREAGKHRLVGIAQDERFGRGMRRGGKGPGDEEARRKLIALAREEALRKMDSLRGCPPPPPAESRRGCGMALRTWNEVGRHGNS